MNKYINFCDIINSIKKHHCNICKYSNNSNDWHCTQCKYMEVVEELEQLPYVNTIKYGQWTPISEHLPDCEQEVLICTEKKLIGKDAYIDSIITPAIYEDGTMLENNSKWRWEDIDYAGWDEEEDCGIIPQGWWENRHFNPDDVYNNPVDRKVVAWMPLPEPFKEDSKV